MEELSLTDKFGILFNNILEHPLFLVLFFVPIVLFFLQKKHGKKIYIIVYFIAILSVLIIGGDELFKIFDNFMDGLFMVLYFPNFITLFIVILLNAIFAFVSLFSRDMHKVNKGINYVFFGIVQSLFILVILAIRSNDLNIYKDNALYSNNEVLSLMQLLIGAFGIQLVSLLIINLINRVTSILDRKESELSDSINEQIDSLKGSKKNVTLGNGVGYINVADKTKSSTPILRPFKFDLEKLQSIKLDVDSRPKVLTPIKLKNRSASYLNEIVKPRNLKPIVLDSSKFVKLEVPSKGSTRFKSVVLDSSEVSYLNEIVKPRKFKTFKLNPWKYINMDVPNNKAKKLFKGITLNSNNFSYLNEVLKDYKFKSLDSSKSVNLEVPSRDYNEVRLKNKDFSYLNEIFSNASVVRSSFPKKFYKKVKLKNKDFSYINECVKNEKYKIFKLDSSKFINLNTESVLRSKKLDEKDFSYKNEIVSKYKPINLKEDKALNTNLNVKTEPKKYSFLSLKDKAIGYLNEVMNVRKFKPVELDSNKIQSIEVNGPKEENKKAYSTFSLDSNKDVSLNVPIHGKESNNKFVSGLVKGTNPDNDFDKLFNSKPDLMKPMDDYVKTFEPEVTPLKTSKPTVVETMSIDNLRIIDIQSTLDTVSKYHLYKEAKLSGFNEKDSVDNLSIPNFELLLEVLNNYSLIK